MHKRKNTKQLIGYIIRFLLGFAAITLPILIWLICGKALDAFLYDYLAFNFIYSSAIKTDPTSVIKAVNFFIMSGPVLISVPILVYVLVKERKMIDILCLVSLVLSILLSSVSGQQYEHYGMIFCPITIFSAVRFFVLQNERKDKLLKAVYISSLSLLLIAYSANFVYFLYPLKETILNRESEYYNEMKKAAEIIKNNTEETDKISVCGNLNLIYLLADRESSSRYSFQYPIIEFDTEIKNEYVSDISKLETEIIVINNIDTMHNILEEILDKHYELIDTAGVLYIYKKLPDT